MQMPPLDPAILARRSEIVAALRTIVPGEGVIDDLDGMRPYECDALSAYRQMPLVVVLLLSFFNAILKPLLVLDHFGQFSAADHDAALLELLREGRIACRWSPAAPPADAAEQSERVPGPQDFLEFLETRTRPTWRRQ